MDASGPGDVWCGHKVWGSRGRKVRMAGGLSPRARRMSAAGQLQRVFNACGWYGPAEQVRGGQAGSLERHHEELLRNVVRVD
jgi:hypothetical protein